ncbi:hypothetical protein DHEL01_v204237 [Diaporthe helianthi]|uniref:Uncharacterized protein n=1 Tax=Diaporthe helianthi TaxID=158607 RepID=A0A2P5I4C6_DIAHE|nr:hypothetical protein DHEL01_v204237 [Diaporthe helianthi]
MLLAASPGLLHRLLVAAGILLGVVLLAALIFWRTLRCACIRWLLGESVVSVVVCGVVEAVKLGTLKRWIVEVRGGGRDTLAEVQRIEVW